MIALIACCTCSFALAGPTRGDADDPPARGASADVGDGRLAFLPGVWSVHGWARVDVATRNELDAVMVVAPWTDGLLEGYAKTAYARPDWPADGGGSGGRVDAEGLAGTEPVSEGYWLWDDEARGWCSLAGWRPDYMQRALGFGGRDEPCAAATTGSDAFGAFEDVLSFEIAGADAWEFRVDRSYADGTNVGLCHVVAERMDGSAGVIEQPVGGGEDSRVTTLMEGFGGSRALAIDDEGTLYFGADRDGSGSVPILARSTDGRLRTVAEGLAPAGLVWRDGALWVHAHDVDGGRVVRITSDGGVEEIGRLDGDPLAVDSRGRAYTVIGDEVLQLRHAGEVEVWARSELLAGAFALTHDDATNTLITGIWKSGRVYRLRRDREPELIGRIPGSGRGSCAWITMDGDDVLATSFGGSRVYRLAPDGAVSLVAGQGLVGDVDGPGRMARFHNPNGIAIAPGGEIVYVAEIRPGPLGPFAHGRLRRIDLGQR